MSVPKQIPIERQLEYHQTLARIHNHAMRRLRAGAPLASVVTQTRAEYNAAWDELLESSSRARAEFGLLVMRSSIASMGAPA